MNKIIIDEASCSLCGLCIDACVRRNLVLGIAAVEVIKQDRCLRCGHCRAICPSDAIHFPDLDESEYILVSSLANPPTPRQLDSLFRTRRSIRSFRPAPVPDDIIHSVLNAGRFVPSSNNVQAVQMTVIRSTSSRQDLWKETTTTLNQYGRWLEAAVESHQLTGQPLSEKEQIRQSYIRFFREVPELFARGEDRIFWGAPVVLILHLDHHLTPFPQIDAGLAAMQMLLMAESFGLGTCLCGLLVYALEQSPDLKEMFGIPGDHLVPIAFVLGYPQEKYSKTVARQPSQVTWL